MFTKWLILLFDCHFDHTYKHDHIEQNATRMKCTVISFHLYVIDLKFELKKYLYSPVD